MAISSFSNFGTATAAKWDEKLVFAALIAQGAPKIAVRAGDGAVRKRLRTSCMEAEEGVMQGAR